MDTLLHTAEVTKTAETTIKFYETYEDVTEDEKKSDIPSTINTPFSNKIKPDLHFDHTPESNHKPLSQPTIFEEYQYPTSGLRIHEDSICSISTSPHQPLIASIGDDYRLVLYKITSDHKLQCIRRIKKKYLPVSIAFDNTGDCLAIAMIDGVIEIWDVSTMKPIYTLKGHTGSVLKCKWSPAHRNTLLSIANDKTYRIWHPHSLPSKHNSYVKRFESQLVDIQWQQTMKFDGKIAITDSQNTLRIFNAFTGQSIVSDDITLRNARNEKNRFARNGRKKNENIEKVRNENVSNSLLSSLNQHYQQYMKYYQSPIPAYNNFDECFVAHSMGNKMVFGEISLVCVDSCNLNILDCQRFQRLNTIKTSVYHNYDGNINDIDLQNDGCGLFATSDESDGNIMCLWRFSANCNYAECCGRVFQTHCAKDRNVYGLKNRFGRTKEDRLRINRKLMLERVENDSSFVDKEKSEEYDGCFITNLEFCKHVPRYLLSAGKDGTVKLWDCEKLTSHFSNLNLK